MVDRTRLLGFLTRRFAAMNGPGRVGPVRSFQDRDALQTMADGANHHDPVGDVARQILTVLRQRAAQDDLRPLGPSGLPSPPPDKLFLAAVVRLQDGGLIMSEALLVGTGPEPQLREPSITRKGLLALASGEPL